MIEVFIAAFGVVLLGMATYYIFDTIRIRREVMVTLSKPANGSSLIPNREHVLSSDEKYHVSVQSSDGKLKGIYVDLAERILPSLVFYSRNKQEISIDESESFQFDSDIFNGFLWMMKEINRALLQLESDNADEVLAGYQTISALGIPFFLPYLEKVSQRWLNDSRVMQQMGAAKEMIAM